MDNSKSNKQKENKSQEPDDEAVEGGLKAQEAVCSEDLKKEILRGSSDKSGMSGMNKSKEKSCSIVWTN